MGAGAGAGRAGLREVELGSPADDATGASPGPGGCAQRSLGAQQTTQLAPMKAQAQVQKGALQRKRCDPKIPLVLRQSGLQLLALRLGRRQGKRQIQAAVWCERRAFASDDLGFWIW